MTIIANPIYDVVFKYMMEDDRVAKLLLSALLQKEVLSLKMRRHEYTGMRQTRISLFRIDFSANVRNEDGTENLILIELQKTWLTTETLRFRQYLGTQYLDKDNVSSDESEKGYGLPIVSIYILGHKLGDLTEPVIYVRRRYLDYDSNPITEGVPDKFIESLTHDSIIIQIPYLKGRVRNRLERILNVFDQDYCMKGNEHLLEIDEDLFHNDEQILVSRLVKAAVAPDVRRAMDVEDEILSEIEARDTTIMLKDKKIKEKEEKIKEKDNELKEKDNKLKEKDNKLKEKDDKLKEKDDKLKEKDDKLKEKDDKLKEKDRALDAAICVLYQNKLTIADIAAQLFVSEQDVIGALQRKGLIEKEI